MLLSIDRVLQLLAEGKSLEKIAQLADCETEQVVSIIQNARALLLKHEKPYTKKKIVIKKSEKDSDGPNLDSRELSDLFEGAELSAVPLDSHLTIYTDGASSGNPGPAGIGIVIYDKEDRQVGKVSHAIGSKTNNYAEYMAIVRALKIARYFRANSVKIRTDSELIVKQISGEYQIKNQTLKKLYDEVTGLMASIKSCRVEHVSRNFNDKADFLAKKAISGKGSR